MALLQDTFSGASENLNGRTMDSGHNWDAVDRGLQTDGSGNCQRALSGTNQQSAIANPTSADYSVSGTLRTGGTAGTDRAGIWGRFNGNTDGTDNGYLTFLRGDTGSITLYEISNGAASTIGSAYSIPSFSATTDYKITLDMSGTTIRVLVDDVEQISGTDSTHSSAGQPGVYMRDTNALITLFESTNAASTGSNPTISGVTDPVKPGDTLTISGSNLDTVTSVTFAGVSVTLDSQTASAIDITVPSAYTNGLAFQSQTVQVTDGSTPDSTTTTFNPPTNIDYNGAVSGYDALPEGQYSIFDDVTLSVVDGDDYVVRDPNTIINSLDASGAGDFTTTGDIFVRVLDVSDTTDGPDGTWTVERTVSITASQVSSIVRKRLGRNSSGLFGWF